MKKIIFYFLLLLALFSACSKKKQIIPKPNNLIPYDTMTVIMSETFLIEGMLYYLPPDSDRTASALSVYSDLFARYNISKDQFISSVRYYLADKTTSEELLTKVAQIVEAKKDEFNRQNENMLELDNQNLNPNNEISFQ